MCQVTPVLGNTLMESQAVELSNLVALIFAIRAAQRAGVIREAIHLHVLTRTTLPAGRIAGHTALLVLLALPIKALAGLQGHLRAQEVVQGAQALHVLAVVAQVEVVEVRVEEDANPIPDRL